MSGPLEGGNQNSPVARCAREEALPDSVESTAVSRDSLAGLQPNGWRFAVIGVLVVLAGLALVALLLPHELAGTVLRTLHLAIAFGVLAVLQLPLLLRARASSEVAFVVAMAVVITIAAAATAAEPHWIFALTFLVVTVGGAALLQWDWRVQVALAIAAIALAAAGVFAELVARLGPPALWAIAFGFAASAAAAAVFRSARAGESGSAPNGQSARAAPHTTETQMSAIFNTAVDGIITCDGTGRILSFNPAAEPLFGFAAEEVIGRPIETLIPNVFSSDPHDPTTTDHRPKEVLATRLETFGVRCDGSKIPIDLTLSVLEYGQGRLITAIVRDNSERKRAEESHRLFLAATSHDMRNALTTIVGYAELLADGVDPADSREMVNRIGSLAKDLSGIMTDIVVHAAGQSSDVRWETISARTLLHECAVDAQRQCEKKGLRFLLDLPPDELITTDPMRLRRVVENLLSNAIRYTRVGEVHLSGELNGDWLPISVRDTGIGIPLDALERVFDEYYRHVEAQRVEPLGTGLGLPTVRRFCVQLGGEVSVQSSPGVGSTFIVLVPRSPAR